MQRGSALIAYLQPLTNGDVAKALADAGVTAFAMEAVPRITRAQSMDALSSQATVAGYRAALIAAQELGRFFPMLTTAAGTIRPAKVLVLGAGVAGLQAIATARRLGAVVSAFDVRSAVKEQIESLGARFVELDIGLEDAEDAGGYARALTDEEQQRQREALADVIAQMDIVISTAAVPGRKAPLLVIEDAVKRMPAGSVIVDLAAETGGNCELTEPGQTVVRHDVKIVGPENLAGDDARPRFPALREEHPVAARPDGRRGGRLQARLRRRGDRRRLHHARRRDRPRGRPCGLGSKRTTAAGHSDPGCPRRRPEWRRRRPGGLTGMDLITELTILVLAAFVGFEVISKVPNTLHTPLMSATNAIHGIVMLGGILVIGSADGFFDKFILVIAIAFGTINVVGGFLVTDRMLEMFKKRPEPKKAEASK